jgi:hypothetical protein
VFLAAYLVFLIGLYIRLGDTRDPDCRSSFLPVDH